MSKTITSDVAATISRAVTMWQVFNEVEPQDKVLDISSVPFAIIILKYIGPRTISPPTLSEPMWIWHVRACGHCGAPPPVTRAAAVIGLALYAVCVYSANIKHAIDSLSVTEASMFKWLYHLPRLALQPVFVWLPLYASGLLRWPVTRCSNDEGLKPTLDYSAGEDISTVRTNGDSDRGRDTIPETGKVVL